MVTANPVPGSAGPGTGPLRDHLTTPLKDGGHGFSEASYTVAWCDTEEFHDLDHSGEEWRWFSEGLLHTHPEVNP